MTDNDAHLSSEVASPISQQRERRRALIITWGSVVATIGLAGSLTTRMIDLDTQAHPQISLTNILIQDIFGPISGLVLFGFCCSTLIERVLRKRPDRT